MNARNFEGSRERILTASNSGSATWRLFGYRVTAPTIFSGAWAMANKPPTSPRDTRSIFAVGVTKPEPLAPYPFSMHAFVAFLCRAPVR